MRKKQRKVKGGDAAVPVRKSRVNPFNTLQRELSGYLRERGVDWQIRTGKSSFAAVAGAVYRDMPDEVRKGGARAIGSYVDTGGFDDVFPVVVSPPVKRGRKKKGKGGKDQLRLSDLQAIFGRFGGSTNWWLFFSTLQELTAVTPEFKAGDTVDFEGSGILNNYIGISGTQAGGAAWEIHTQMKRIFNDSKKRRAYSGVAVLLDEEESIARSTSDNLVIVFSLIPDMAIDHLQAKNKILSTIVTIDDRKSGDSRVVGKEEQKTGVTVVTTPVEPETKPEISETERHNQRMAELIAKAKIEAIEIKKLEKKLAAEVKKAQAKSKQKIAIERIKSKERTDKIRISESVKSIDKLFRDGKITFKQYSSMILKLKK